MNRIIKVGIAAFALSAFAPAFADEAEELEVEEEGVVGYTPIALGLASPVQVPWGLARWDVYGLDLNVFYSDAPKAYGILIGGLAATTRDTMKGIAIAPIANLAFNADPYGLRTTLGLDYVEKSFCGLGISSINVSDEICGLGVHALGAYQQSTCGAQICGLANISRVESHGAYISGITNYAPVSRGLQLALIYNMTRELHGAQIGLVNYTELCPSGFQIGLVNIIMQNSWKVLPIVNCYF